MHLLCTQFEAGVPVVQVQMIAEIMVGRADSHHSVHDFFYLQGQCYLPGLSRY